MFDPARIVRARRLACLILAWPVAAAAQTAIPFKDELQKQQSIYHTERPAGYVTDRTLQAYIDAMPATFEQVLSRLSTTDRWLDVGAGEAQAILDYHAPPVDERKGKASAVALSIEDRRTRRWHETAARLGINKIQYLHGRPFGEFSSRELGRFQLITDMIGGFSYTTRIDRYMERALDVLTTHGSLFTLLQDVHGEAAGNKPYYPNSTYLTTLSQADGTELKVCTWLKKIACAEVTCGMRMDWKPPVEIYHVRKTCDAVRVPPLVPVHFAAGTPPERRYTVSE